MSYADKADVHFTISNAELILKMKMIKSDSNFNFNLLSSNVEFGKLETKFNGSVSWLFNWFGRILNKYLKTNTQNMVSTQIFFLPLKIDNIFKAL